MDGTPQSFHFPLEFLFVFLQIGESAGFLSELAASSTSCCPVGTGLPQLDADAIPRSESDARQWVDLLAGSPPQAEPTGQRGQQQCRFHHRKASTGANPRARTYNLLDIATIVGARRHE